MRLLSVAASILRPFLAHFCGVPSANFRHFLGLSKPDGHGLDGGTSGLEFKCGRGTLLADFFLFLFFIADNDLFLDF